MSAAPCRERGCSNRIHHDSQLCWHHRGNPPISVAVPELGAPVLATGEDPALLVDRVLAGEVLAVPLTLDGVRMHYTLNSNSDQGDVFTSTDQPFEVMLTTEDGLEVHIWDLGGLQSLPARGGGEIDLDPSSTITPGTGAGNVLFGAISQHEYDVAVVAYRELIDLPLIGRMYEDSEDDARGGAVAAVEHLHRSAWRVTTRFQLLAEGQPKEWVDAYLEGSG